MGVMACNRSSCPNVMCDRYLNGLGYLCNDCFSELRDWRTTWPEEMTAGEVEEKIKEFFATEPGSLSTKKLNREEIDAEFRRITGEDP